MGIHYDRQRITPPLPGKTHTGKRILHTPVSYTHLAKRSTGKTVPVLIQSGWFDDNGMGTTEALDLTAGYPPGTRKVVLGPWQHSGNSCLLYTSRCV